MARTEGGRRGRHERGAGDGHTQRCNGANQLLHKIRQPGVAQLNVSAGVIVAALNSSKPVLPGGVVLLAEVGAAADECCGASATRAHPESTTVSSAKYTFRCVTPTASLNGDGIHRCQGAGSIGVWYSASVPPLCARSEPHAAMSVGCLNKGREQRRRVMCAAEAARVVQQHLGPSTPEPPCCLCERIRLPRV